MEEVGVVLSLNNTPNTYEYYFVIEREGFGKVRKGMYVSTRNEQGIVLGFLEDIQRANKYLENAEAVADYGASTLQQHFPLKEWDYLVAHVSILGVALPEGGKYRYERTVLPPTPGQPVFSASNEMLKDFLGFDENGLNIGKVFGHDVEAKINLTRMFQKHLAILAMSGAGKSNLAKVLIEELTKREKRKVAALVLDVHGEYAGLRRITDKVKVVDGEDIRIPITSLTPHLLRDLFPSMSEVGYRALTSFFKRTSLEGKQLRDLIAELEEAEIKSNVKAPLIEMLEELETYKIVGNEEKPFIPSFVEAGKVAIVNLAEISNFKKLQFIAYYILKRLFELRRASVKEGKKLIPPTIAFIEEAHNFAPKDFTKELGMAKRQVEKIAREGRKFNLSLCLITQRPSHLSQTALSQCSSQIILRIANPNDLKFIGESSEAIDSRTLKAISTLSVGEGILLGEAVNAPVFIKFRKSSAGKSSISKTLEEEAEEFEKEEEDAIDAYL